jgi:predicted negative regulator of RcsB-dependent stress response
MANQLDLEEQEQLDQLKHFWNQYGNLISGLLIVVLGAVAAWNGYHYWQRSQAAQSAAMFDEMSKSVAAGDLAMAQRTFSDMKERYASATYTQQAGLALARQASDKGELDIAKTALQWVVDKSGDEGYAAIARLRLANIYFDAKDYAKAMTLLDGVADEAFAALVADRKGDILAIQDKRVEAKAAYLVAYQKLEERAQYRRVIQVKLNALGVDPEALAAPKVAEGLK